jgi:hypothetical protein
VPSLPQKRSKRLFAYGAVCAAATGPRQQQKKVFWFFSAEKNTYGALGTMGDDQSWRV